jgi:hypothetical protein
MKISFDTDKLVSKAVEYGVRGYDSAKAAAPSAKDSILSFKDRVKKAANKGVKAARRK